MNGSTWTEVQWGVLHETDSGRLYGPKAGEVESFGTRPGGETGQFSESDARYIARSGKNRSVVRRIVVHTRTHFDWEPVQ